jgi:hypothetical protein
MHEYKCDLCGQRATIHETVIEHGEHVGTRRHCEEHAMDTLPDAIDLDDPGSQTEFATLVDWYNSLADSAKSRIQLDYA